MQINTKYQSREIEDFLLKSRGSNMFRTSFFKLYFLGFQFVLNSFFQEKYVVDMCLSRPCKKGFCNTSIKFLN